MFMFLPFSAHKAPSDDINLTDYREGCCSDPSHIENHEARLASPVCVHLEAQETYFS